MVAYLLPEGRQSFEKGDGTPAVGWKLYTYAAGTNTPQMTWADEAQTAPNTNPIVMDARGEAPIYFNGDYKLVLKDQNDVTIWTQDNVQAVPSSIYLNLFSGSDGSSFVGFLGNGTGTVPRTVQSKLRERISPKDYGAVGDGIADDGDALNRMFAYIRTLIAANSFTAITVDGANAQYRTTKSLNVTGLAAWSLTVRDMFVIGECVGKAVFDLIATRGYVFENVSVYGSKTSRPAVAIQAQRGTPNGFCDNCSFRDCNIDGWFSRAAVHDYGQETTQWSHCTVFNRDHTARVAIHEGYSANPMTSDYASIMTGGTSFINKQFLNCDYRYLPADENIASITGITNAVNAVITAPGHAFVGGDQVVFQYVANMLEMTAKIATVTSVTATTFTVNVDTSAMGAFGGSGNAIRRATKSPIYIARCSGFAMHDCYVVSYGRVPIEIGFPDPGFLRVAEVTFSKMLFEGAGQTAEVGFSPTAACTVLGFQLSTYNTHSYVSLLENLNPAFTISIYACDIQAFDPTFNNVLVNSPSTMAAYDARITFSSLADVNPDGWSLFNGQITSILTGKNTLWIADQLTLNAGRMRLNGVVSVGGATPSLGSNKPGTNGAPVMWEDRIVDGVTYVTPLWAKS